jgi:Protein of unknown function (DUF4013)
VTSVGDSFGWPFQDPGWFGKMIVQGLIFIIPIVGWIALYGWLVMAIDNYRAGRRELPPAGFHLGRGVALFVVYLVWVIVFNIPGGIFSGAGSGGHNSAAAGFGSLLGFLLGLFLAFLVPAIYLNTYRAGFSGGFDISAIWRTATSNVSTTIVAALLIIVAGIISVAGVIVCCVGLLFTIPYGAAIIAGVVAWYERELAGPAPMPTQPA